MAEGIYGIRCPKCGKIDINKLQQACGNCKEALYPKVKAKLHKQEEIQQEGIIEISTSQDIASQVQIHTPEKPKATVRITLQLPKLYCESDPKFSVEIKKGDTIGREGSINVTPLPRSEYISRKHATFIQQGNQWFLRAESKSNPTMVNFKQINPGEIEPLKDGDCITLADTTFIFRVS